MKLNQVALQLYTLRDFLKTPGDIAATLRRVRQMGYRAVQVSGLGPIPEDDLVAILRDNGLTCCATHEQPEMIREQPQRVVERLRKLGCRHTAYPFPKEVDWSKPEDIERLTRDLDRAGAVLREAGQVLSYHNHAIEFLPFRDGTVLDHIYAQTAPENLQGEIDTYWVQFGGGDPAAWCRKLKNRLPLLHLKDYVITRANQPTFAALGAGVLNWPEIIRAADASGCEWFIVEQDTTPGDPFDAVRQSLEFIAENLAAG